jgi:GNAT superfamily N-acetyltransferase
MRKPDTLIGYRTHQKSSLLLAFSKALPSKMRSKTREVLEVYTEPGFRGLGWATKLLEDVCAEADKHRLMLIVFPKPYSTASSEPNAPGETRLTSWYVNHFGFEMIQTEPVVMLARPPVLTRTRDNPKYISESIK